MEKRNDTLRFLDAEVRLFLEARCMQPGTDGLGNPCATGPLSFIEQLRRYFHCDLARYRHMLSVPYSRPVSSMVDLKFYTQPGSVLLSTWADHRPLRFFDVCGLPTPT